MFDRMNKRLESWFPNSTKGNNRYLTYGIISAVACVAAYVTYSHLYGCNHHHHFHHHHGHDHGNDNKEEEESTLSIDSILENKILKNHYCLITNYDSKIIQNIIKKLINKGCIIIVLTKENESNKFEDLKSSIIYNSTNLKEMKDLINIQLISMPCNLNDLTSIQRFIQSFLSLNLPLHYLINNNDIMPLNKYTKDNYGNETTFINNYLSLFYLTYLLTPKLIESSKLSNIQESRIINIISSGYTMSPSNLNEWIQSHLQMKKGPIESDYSVNGWKVYGISKSCMILWTREYNKRFEQNNVRSFCMKSDIIALPNQSSEQQSSLSSVPAMSSSLNNQQQQQQVSGVSSSGARCPFSAAQSGWKYYLNKITTIFMHNTHHFHHHHHAFLMNKKKTSNEEYEQMTLLKLMVTNKSEIAKGGNYWNELKENNQLLPKYLQLSNDNNNDNNNSEQLLWQLSEELLKQCGLQL
jgi:NAD(P)-dependent dehydrogenase (short-subunit alcohol dehydrogenase family)